MSSVKHPKKPTAKPASLNTRVMPQPMKNMESGAQIRTQMISAVFNILHH